MDPNTQPSDEDLAQRARAGARAAFAELVHRHHGRIFAFHRSAGNCREDAEDFTQEAFLRAFKSIHRYNPEQPFLPWLYTIARREAIRCWRRTKKTESLESAPEPSIAAHSPDERGAQLWQVARSQLRPVAYTALWLHYQEDLPLREVAQSINKSENATKVLIHRARQTLKQRLRPQQEAFLVAPTPAQNP